MKKDFGKTKPITHFLVFIPLLFMQSMLSFNGWLYVGLLSWTFIEYVIHRFAFHSASSHVLAKPFNSALHELHHNDPNNIEYVAAPLILAVPVYVLIALGLSLVTSLATVNSLMAGITIGFLMYEMLHYAAHHHSAKGPVLKFLKRQHMMHHFVDHTKSFGVTSPLWDKIFKT